MAYLVLVVESDDSIDDLNAKVQSSNKHHAMQKLVNYLKGSQSGAGSHLTVEVTSRDSDVVVSTSGTNSDQKTHSY